MYKKSLTFFYTPKLGLALVALYLVLSMADLLLINSGASKDSYYSQPIHNLTIVAGCFAALSVSEWLVRRGVRVRKVFPQSSFVVFAFHSFVLYDITKILFKLFFKGNFTSIDELLLYIASIFLTMVVSMLVYAVMRKTRILSLLFIGR